MIVIIMTTEFLHIVITELWLQKYQCMSWKQLLPNRVEMKSLKKKNLNYTEGKWIG